MRFFKQLKSDNNNQQAALVHTR